MKNMKKMTVLVGVLVSNPIVLVADSEKSNSQTDNTIIKREVIKIPPGNKKTIEYNNGSFQTDNTIIKRQVIEIPPGNKKTIEYNNGSFQTDNTIIKRQVIEIRPENKETIEYNNNCDGEFTECEFSHDRSKITCANTVYYLDSSVNNRSIFMKIVDFIGGGGEEKETESSRGTSH